jgi:hypothetical protein
MFIKSTHPEMKITEFVDRVRETQTQWDFSAIPDLKNPASKKTDFLVNFGKPFKIYADHLQDENATVEEFYGDIEAVDVYFREERNYKAATLRNYIDYLSYALYTTPGLEAFTPEDRDALTKTLRAKHETYQAIVSNEMRQKRHANAAAASAVAEIAGGAEDASELSSAEASENSDDSGSGSGDGTYNTVPSGPASIIESAESVIRHLESLLEIRGSELARLRSALNAANEDLYERDAALAVSTAVVRERDDQIAMLKRHTESLTTLAMKAIGVGGGSAVAEAVGA